MSQKEHLPIFGVGPFYGSWVIVSTVIGIVLSAAGILKSGLIGESWLIWAFAIVGTVVSVWGIIVWASAALGKRCIDRYIKENKLCTTGIYQYVRNPCYSGIVLACTGALMMAHNLWLLILPPLDWAIMTVLMQQTEEKWLLEWYGDEYRSYCGRVNRCIPWFPRKKK